MSFCLASVATRRAVLISLSPCIKSPVISSFEKPPMSSKWISHDHFGANTPSSPSPLSRPDDQHHQKGSKSARGASGLHRATKSRRLPMSPFAHYLLKNSAFGRGAPGALEFSLARRHVGLVHVPHNASDSAARSWVRRSIGRSTGSGELWRRSPDTDVTRCRSSGHPRG
jgi:hypothetical protein